MKTLTAWIIVILIIGLGIFFFTSDIAEKPDTSGGVVSNEVDSAVRAQVTAFGSKLKNVSLLQPTAQLKNNMQTEYGLYLTPELLKSWQDSPQSALGRQTSSPWPDRINVVEVRELNDTMAEVDASVIEVTSAEQSNTPAAVLPIKLTLEPRGDTWLISSMEKGSYAEIPLRTSVTGAWTCLPHRDTSGPQTMECAFGIRLMSGEYVAVNTMLMPTYPVDYPTWTRVRVEGVLVPEEQLSSDMWDKYNITGIISATSIQRI